MIDKETIHYTLIYRFVRVMEQLQKYLSKPISMYVFQYSIVDRYDVSDADLQYVIPRKGIYDDEYLIRLLRLNRLDLLKRCHVRYWFIRDMIITAAFRDNYPIYEYYLSQLEAMPKSDDCGRVMNTIIYMINTNLPCRYIYPLFEFMNLRRGPVRTLPDHFTSALERVIHREQYWYLRWLMAINASTEAKYACLVPEMAKICLPIPALALILGVTVGFLIIRITIYLEYAFEYVSEYPRTMINRHRIIKLLHLLTDAECNELGDILVLRSDHRSYMYEQCASYYGWKIDM